MSLQRIQIVVGLLCLLPGATRLTAQARGYHMELSDGTTGYVILVNDSSKTIEAFHVAATCKKEGGSRRGGSTSLDYDKLLTPGSSAGWARDRDGRPVGPPQPDVIAPGQRMQSVANLLPQPTGCVWNADIDGVIYTDGTYEGSNDSVRSLQVWRDGLAHELQYWSIKLHPQDEKPFDPYAITSEARGRADSYLGTPMGLKLDYLYGKRQISLSIAMLAAAGNPSPDELRAREVSLINRWQKKLDDDVAFKKMKEIFPLPVEVITSAPRPPAEPATQP